MLQLQHIKSTFARFRANNDGNVAIMTAVGGLAIAGIVALAIDSSGARSAKQELQSQLDVVSLAVATSGITEEQAQMDFALKILAANGYEIDATELSIQMTPNGEVNVTGTVDYANAFTGVWGQENMSIKAHSSAIAGEDSVTDPTDIVLVLDATGSMEGAKLTALQASANKLIDALSDAENDQVQIGMVPFSAYINVGMGQRNASWIDVPDDYTETTTSVERIKTADGYCQGNPNATITEYKDGVPVTTTGCDDYVDAVYEDGATVTSEKDYEWGGCVRPRHNGKNTLHLTDGEYDNDKINGYMHGDWFCSNPVVPLTTQLETVSAGVNALDADWDTYMPAGIIWGQRVLSPEEPFTGGRPDTKQIMVLMTDGVNSLHRWGGSLSRNDIDDPDDADLLEITKQDTVTLCQNVKSDDIELYTIAFEVNDLETKTMLSACASGSSNFFDAGNAKQLEDAFLEIADNITEGTTARLTR